MTSFVIEIFCQLLFCFVFCYINFVIMSANPTDEELQRYAELLQKSGKYTLARTRTTSTPAPILTRQSLTTPEKEYYDETSTARPSSLFDRTSLTSSTRLPPVSQGTPPPIPPMPPVCQGTPPPIPPPPPRLSSLSFHDVPVSYASPRVPKLPPFSGNDKDESAFDIWRYDLNVLLQK